MSWRRFNCRQGAPAWSPGLRRCSAQKPALCAVVVIDEDDDGGDSDSEVFIVDGDAGKAPRCQAKKGDCSSGNVINLGDGSSGNVINLDDDEEEVSRGDQAGPSTARGASSPAVTSPGHASPRNRYGLDCTSDSSESDLSERDTESESDEDSASDCEIMDDSCGTAQKMWETAASSRKKMPNGVHKGNKGMATASTSSSGSETRLGENAEGLFGSECHLDEDVFLFFQAADPQNCTNSARDGPAEYNWNENLCFSDVWEGKQGSTRGDKDGHDPSSVPDAKECFNGNVSDGKETKCVQNSHGDAKDSCAECHINKEAFQHFSHADKEGVQNTTGAAKDGCDPSGQNASKCSNRKVSNGWEYGSPPMYVSTPEKVDEWIPEGICSPKDRLSSDVHNVTSGSCSLSQKDLVDDPKGLGQFTLVQEASDFQEGLIGEREKHKETAEFKRAAEEEWASRQLQLQIQAEEAKKLRKRKKAEALRLLNMEKKQKQRLEEVRESQKKNEEEIQLKEQYRCVVRKELEDTERRYRDTQSILHALGIPVEGAEVRAAIKQAQVKFHPDRVSRNDIYQQVKAEETFKFISRLKEKLPCFL